MIRASVFFVLSIFFLAACGGGEESPKSPAAASAPPAAEKVAAAAPTPPQPPAAPPGALDCKNPTGELRGDAARGSKLYAQTCASCHGAAGKGDGPAAMGLNPKPADHTDPARMGPLSDKDIYTVICAGGAAVGKSPLMAGWGPVVGDQGIRDLIAHIRSLSGH